jgi:hypothetical protein
MLTEANEGDDCFQTEDDSLLDAAPIVMDNNGACARGSFCGQTREISISPPILARTCSTDATGCCNIDARAQNLALRFFFASYVSNCVLL